MYQKSALIRATTQGRPYGSTFRNVDSTGWSRTSPLRNPRQSEKGFSTRLIRALDETSHFRATTWGRPYGGRTGHPRITNICLASRASLGRAPTASEHALFCSVFVGATLRGRPFRNVNFTGRSRTLPLRNPRQSEKGFSSRLIRALDETSRFEIRGTRYNVFPLGTSAHWMKRHVSKSAAIGKMFFLSVHPRIGSSVTLVCYASAEGNVQNHHNQKPTHNAQGSGVRMLAQMRFGDKLFHNDI